MQALKIRLQGRYWDSFIYDDVLLLVTENGEIETYSWDRIVAEIASQEDSAEPAITHLATRAQAWYGLAVRDLLRNDELRASMVRQVERAARERFVVPRKKLLQSRTSVGGVSNFPTTDIECYLHRLYFASTDGVIATELRDVAESGVRDVDRIYDGPSLKVAASYGHLAIAQGPDGLVEALTELPEWEWKYGRPARLEPRLVSAGHCDTCSWNAFDVVGTQVGGGGFVGAFRKPEANENVHRPDRPRDLIGTISSEELFAQAAGTLVGGQGLLALIQDEDIVAESWTPRRRRKDHGVDVARSAGQRRKADFSQGDDIVDAALTVFGVVAEFDTRLSIATTDGHRISIPGEPVNWRVFPRSTRYINHLHVVKDDWIDIYAFAHDYFVDPEHRGIGLLQPTVRSW